MTIFSRKKKVEEIVDGDIFNKETEGLSQVRSFSSVSSATVEQ